MIVAMYKHLNILRSTSVGMTVGRKFTDKEVSQVSEDCLACRLVGGGGCLGASLYVAYHGSRNTNLIGRSLTFLLGAALAGVGITRLLRLPPFDKSKWKHQS
ncbi:uncharacterized protein [Cherax quadricarinatus]|uniref:uncharacterized protein n=1 Tax=Cherax quadricarinatus TaxID=27406 RepID=UPI00387EE6D1